MGYKKILVAVDRFQHTQVVIDHALDMGGTVRLLNMFRPGFSNKTAFMDVSRYTIYPENKIGVT